MKETQADKRARVSASLQRKGRNLSGWNVFQRERLKDSQKSRADYATDIRTLSAEWKQLDAETKEAYEIQAKFEQEARDQVKSMPLPCKNQPLSEQEQLAGAKARSKMSMQRLLRNFANAAGDPVWTRDTQFGDSASSKCLGVPRTNHCRCWYRLI